MSADRGSPPQSAELARGVQLDQEEPNASSSSSWPTLSEGTVPLLDDLERVEAEEREARWRVVTSGRLGPSRGRRGSTRSTRTPH